METRRAYGRSALLFRRTRPCDGDRQNASGDYEPIDEWLGVDLEKEMPYHETLTVFWMKAVADFAMSKNGISLLDKANEVVEKFDKDYPLRFYSRGLLFSERARAMFVDPDLTDQ